MAKIEDLRQKSDDQLAEELTSLKREQLNLRFQAATNQLERSARVKEVRREIAQPPHSFLAHPGLSPSCSPPPSLSLLSNVACDP